MISRKLERYLDICPSMIYQHVLFKSYISLSYFKLLLAYPAYAAMLLCRNVMMNNKLWWAECLLIIASKTVRWQNPEQNEYMFWKGESCIGVFVRTLFNVRLTMLGNSCFKIKQRRCISFRVFKNNTNHASEVGYLINIFPAILWHV